MKRSNVVFSAWAGVAGLALTIAFPPAGIVLLVVAVYLLLRR